MNDTSAVRFQGLTKHFGDLCAVDHLNLEIRQGETVALLGPNGAGKTTTISMLLGLLAPDHGGVSVLGMPPEAAIQSGRIGAMCKRVASCQGSPSANCWISSSRYGHLRPHASNL